MTIRIESPRFRDGETIPKMYTGEGPDVSPPLTWTGLPAGTRTLAPVCDDPDAPSAEPWVHWVIYGLPATLGGLPEGLPKQPRLDNPPARQGGNDFGRTGYGGPMPPKGHGTHHYHFRLYALDDEVDLPPGVDKARLLAAIHPHVLASGELVGTYERK
jgi:Raf kinase inhibitor-like YbhB/YbcL family protein